MMAAAMVRLLAVPAWAPLLEPMQLDDYWLILLVPLVIAISLVYKTIRMNDLTKLYRQAAYMAAQIFVFLVTAAIALWVFTSIV